MSDRPTLKSYFQTGDIPTESNFIDLIDSMMLRAELQSVLIALVSANTGRDPLDNEVIGYESVSGNLIWTTGGGDPTPTYTASLDFSDARNSMYLALLEDI
jgi:hypothetical protein